jgi:hypothetical protein
MAIGSFRQFAETLKPLIRHPQQPHFALQAVSPSKPDCIGRISRAAAAGAAEFWPLWRQIPGIALMIRTIADAPEPKSKTQSVKAAR